MGQLPSKYRVKAAKWRSFRQVPTPKPALNGKITADRFAFASHATGSDLRM
jgi:hypothetical protein